MPLDLLSNLVLLLHFIQHKPPEPKACARQPKYCRELHSMSAQMSA